jgi:hypothetical protein
MSRPALEPTHPPIQWVPGALSLGVKQPGFKADHSPTSNTEVKNALRYTSTPPICFPFMAWCSGKAQGQLYFTYATNVIEIRACIVIQGSLIYPVR